MADLVNLRAARKARARAEAADAAAQNRARHGRTRAERQRDEADAAARRRLLDGARLEPEAQSGGPPMVTAPKSGR